MTTKDEILALARLSKIYVPDEEAADLTKEMDKIISFAGTINRASSEYIGFDSISGLCNVMRDDTVTPSFRREKILENTDEKSEGYFLLRRRSDD